MTGQFIVLFFISFKLFLLVSLYTAGNLLILLLPLKVALNQKQIFRGLNLLTVYWIKISFTQAQVMYGIQ
ncbi:hypothetical protein D3C85_1322330 [compost metagenome]